MADKKLEKALYGPSMTEVALGAVLGLVIGVLGACVYLVFKPVALVKELPKEPLLSVVYYIPGNESNAKSKGWQAKQKQFARLIRRKPQANPLLRHPRRKLPRRGQFKRRCGVGFERRFLGLIHVFYTART